MNIESVYILEDRGLLFIQGADTKEFLQNLITNDINKVDDDNSCFASLLTPQGKYLFDFLLVKHKNGYFIDCEKKQVDELFKQLNAYKLRSKIEILNLSNEFVVAAFSHEKFLTFKGAKDLEQLRNKLFGIECNFIEMNGIDFKKGCYVGQENTSRIYLKNKLSKRLLPIEIINGKLKEGDKILINDQEIGKVLIDNSYPFALVKYLNDNFDPNAEYKSENSILKINKPKWI